MFKFIQEIRNERKTEIISKVKMKPLLIMSLEGQFLRSYDAPEEGWSCEVLNKLLNDFPWQWGVCGADAYLDNQLIGSTNVL